MVRLGLGCGSGWVGLGLGFNTPGTAGGPGGRDRTLAVKSKKNARKIIFSVKRVKLPPIFYFFGIYLLVMPKYWEKQIFTHGKIHRSGSKAKDGEKKKEREKKRRD